MEKIEIVLQRLSYIKTERKTKEDMVMANFFDEKGKQLSEEELQEAAGGVVIAKGTGFFDRMIQWKCGKCGCLDFTVTGVSQDGKKFYARCKKCGTSYDFDN